MSHLVRRSRFAALLAASVIVSPGFGQEKSIDLASFISGNLVATGKFTDYLARSTRGLQVNIHGVTEGSAFKLAEDMVYSDGETRKWVWKFTKTGAGQYVGQRADLIGKATVVTHGGSVEISYKAHIAMRDGKEHDLDFVETFTFGQSGAADYQMRVSKMFIPVAEAHLTVRKLAAAK